MFRDQARKTADLAFRREQLLEVAALVPTEWMEQCCATGSVENGVAKIAQFSEAGADEVVLYGSSPRDNENLISARRSRTEA